MNNIKSKTRSKKTKAATPEPTSTPMMVAIPAEEGFVVLTRWQVDYLKALISAISQPRIAVRNISNNKARAYEEALERSAENADHMWRVLSDSNVIPAPSPMFGVETEHTKKEREESNKALLINNSLRSAYAKAEWEKNNTSKI